MDAFNIKIGATTFIKRNEFSKIQMINNTLNLAENINELPSEIEQIIKDALIIQENPDYFFKYEQSIDSNELCVTKYLGTEFKNVVIPEEIYGKKVTMIDDAFQNCQSVERLYLPDTLKSLFGYSCAGMMNLNHVYLSKNLKTLSKGVFKDCKCLKTINLKNIENINAFAFYNCERLTNIDIKNVTTVNPMAFKNCISLTKLQLPKIKFIGIEAFKNCINLKSVELGNDLENIPHSVFECCGLKEIILPEKINAIEYNAFYSCAALTKINFPESLCEIEDNAFTNSGLKGEIIFPKNLSSIGEEAFTGTKITGITISENTTYTNDAFPIDALTNIKFYNSINKTTKEEVNER